MSFAGRLSGVASTLSANWRLESSHLFTKGLYSTHTLRTYNFLESPFYLTAENRAYFQEKRVMPFLSSSSLQSIQSFQSITLDKVNQLTKDTALERASLYRVVYATRNQLDKALLQSYASQAWNMDFFLGQFVICFCWGYKSSLYLVHFFYFSFLANEKTLIKSSKFT